MKELTECGREELATMLRMTNYLSEEGEKLGDQFLYVVYQTAALRIRKILAERENTDTVTAHLH